MRLIDADDFGNRMYHEAFEKDSDLQKWDSGCWIRYRLFEKVLREQPTVHPARKPGTFLHPVSYEWICSECGCVFEREPHYKFCPECGADMKEVQ